MLLQEIFQTNHLLGSLYFIAGTDEKDPKDPFQYAALLRRRLRCAWLYRKRRASCPPVKKERRLLFNCAEGKNLFKESPIKPAGTIYEMLRREKGRRRRDALRISSLSSALPPRRIRKTPKAHLLSDCLYFGMLDRF